MPDADDPVTASWREIGNTLRNWGRWGTGDQRGTMNFAGPAQIRSAAALVTSGRVFDLSIPLDGAGPQEGPDRPNPQRLMSVIGGTASGGGAFRYNDDVVFMPLQAGTQWDALSHVYYDNMLYNSVPKEAVDWAGASRLGIATQAGGVTGRGVLIDVARHLGVDWLSSGQVIGPRLLTDALRRQGTELAGGDILLIRTGWRRKYLADQDRAAFLGDEPGIGLDCCAWLAGHQVAAVASDNWALEVIPSEVGGESFPVHMVLIRDMGMMIGEMFDLEDLAQDCAGDGVYEFLLCAPVLRFTNGVGSPVSPIAIK
jgi:kynurenine formamidase